MQRENSRSLKRAMPFLKIVLSAAVILILVMNLGQDAVIEAFRLVNWHTLFNAFLISAAFTISRALKWKLLLPDVLIKALIAACFKAQLYSVVLPGQLFGEASKVASLHGENPDDATIAASVIADKITGLLGLLVLGMVGIVFSSTGLPAAIRVSFAAFFFILLFACLFPKIPFLDHLIESVLRLFNACPVKWLQKVSAFLNSAYDAWKEYAVHPWILLRATIVGVFVQFLTVLQLWTVSRNIGLSIPMVEYMWIGAAMSILLLLPVSFAGIGVRDVSLIGFLRLFSVPDQNAVVISAVILIAQLGNACIGAALVLGKQIAGFRQAGKK